MAALCKVFKLAIARHRNWNREGIAQKVAV
jgi:hypothetical protein